MASFPALNTPANLPAKYRSVDPSHKVMIMSSLYGHTEALTSGGFSQSVEADWAPVVAAGGIIGGAGELIALAGEALGASLRFEFGSIVYKGNTARTHTLPLQFQARSDPHFDVLLPIKKLEAMTLPRKAETITSDSLTRVIGPGPRFTGDADEDIINIVIPGIYNLRRVAIVSVTTAFEKENAWSPSQQIALPQLAQCVLAIIIPGTHTFQDMDEQFLPNVVLSNRHRNSRDRRGNTGERGRNATNVVTARQRRVRADAVATQQPGPQFR